MQFISIVEELPLRRARAPRLSEKNVRCNHSLGLCLLSFKYHGTVLRLDR